MKSRIVVSTCAAATSCSSLSVPATRSRRSQGFLAIYGWKATDVDAAKPGGEWQSLEAIVVGNRLTATANGKRMHDNAILPAMTGGALDNDELAPGPIMIQGDHSRVSFRKWCSRRSRSREPKAGKPVNWSNW